MDCRDHTSEPTAYVNGWCRCVVICMKAGSKRRMEEVQEQSTGVAKGQVKNRQAADLLVQCARRNQNRSLDAFGLFLYVSSESCVIIKRKLHQSWR